jgi:hypothetical protein
MNINARSLMWEGDYSGSLLRIFLKNQEIKSSEAGRTLKRICFIMFQKKLYSLQKME